MKVGKSMYGWLICLICLALLGDSRALVMQEATNPDVRWFGFSLLRVTNNPQAQRQPDAVPMLRLDKSRFALGESVFFWVGVESKSGSLARTELTKRSRFPGRLTARRTAAGEAATGWAPIRRNQGVIRSSLSLRDNGHHPLLS